MLRACLLIWAISLHVTACTSYLTAKGLGQFIGSMASGFYSAVSEDRSANGGPDRGKKGVEISGVPKISVDLKDYSPAELCATELTYKLMSAFQADDEFSQRTSYQGGNWRDPSSPSFLPISIGCVPEEFDQKSCRIVCRAELKLTEDTDAGMAGGRTGELETRRQVFARYWAHFPEADRDGIMSRQHKMKLAELRAFRATAGISEGIKRLFAQGHGIRLFSPVHPEDSHFDVQFRSNRRQSICRVVLDTTRTEPPVLPNKRLSLVQSGESTPGKLLAISKLAKVDPVLFYRITADIFNRVPEGMPAVPPRPVENIGHVKDHLERFYKFVGPYRVGTHMITYTVADDDSNACTTEGLMAHFPVARLANRITKCISAATFDLEQKKTLLYRCDEGLPVWSRHPLCPPTSACYGSKMCERMLSCGDGLWIDIRGQNTFEATTRTVKNWTADTLLEPVADAAPTNMVYDYDEGTKAYYEFPAKRRNRHDDDGVIYQKLHVSESRFAFFVAVFYHPASDSVNPENRDYYRRRETFDSDYYDDLDEQEFHEAELAGSSQASSPMLEPLIVNGVGLPDRWFEEKLVEARAQAKTGSDDETTFFSGESDSDERGTSCPVPQRKAIHNQPKSRLFMHQYADGRTKVVMGESEPVFEDPTDIMNEFAVLDGSSDSGEQGRTLMLTSTTPNPYQRTPDKAVPRTGQQKSLQDDLLVTAGSGKKNSLNITKK